MNTLNICILCCLLLAVGTIHAQDTLRPRYGIAAGASINMHTADFRALPGVPNCCPKFESGSGVGPLIGLRYEFPVASRLLLGFGLDYTDQSALLSTREAVAIVSSGELRNGAFDHTIDATLAGIGIEPSAAYRAMDGLLVRAGLRLGLMITKTYAQQETIVEPAATGTFLDSLGRDSGSRIRNANSGELPNGSSVLLQAFAGVEYELPMNADKTLLLTPGINYAFSLTDVVSGYTWKPNALRLSIGLKFTPLPSKDILRDTTFIRDTTYVTVPRGNAGGTRLDKRDENTTRSEDATTITERVTVKEKYTTERPKPSSLVTNLTAVGVDNRREEPIVALRIEEFLQTNTHPLLGFVFFDEASDAIPSRYQPFTRNAAEQFKPEQLFGEDALGIAHNVLNIIGYNMGQYPAAHLNLTGCNADNGQEKGNRELSQRRAQAVKNYLVNVWGIASDRITVTGRNLPETPSNTRTVDGSEENRRVEIVSTVPEVTDVFVAYDTVRTATPDAVRFKPQAKANESIASWTLTVSQEGTVLKRFSGKGTPPKTVDWDLSTERRNLPRLSVPLVAELQAVTTDGEQSVSQTSIPTTVITVQQKRQEKQKDYHIDRYNLVLFQVGKSTITTAHARTTDLIRSRLKPGSLVTVEGYTDRTGDDASNKRLALSRAQSTAQALQRNDANVVGVGEDKLLYPNDTPEGRFYCRTVQIVVKTPVER